MYTQTRTTDELEEIQSRNVVGKGTAVHEQAKQLAADGQLGDDTGTQTHTCTQTRCDQMDRNFE
jgi:uncharacterized protein (UPF0548 family)